MLTKKEECKYAIEISVILALLMALAWYLNQHIQHNPYRITESRFVVD